MKEQFEVVPKKDLLYLEGFMPVPKGHDVEMSDLSRLEGNNAQSGGDHSFSYSGLTATPQPGAGAAAGGSPETASRKGKKKQKQNAAASAGAGASAELAAAVAGGGGTSQPIAVQSKPSQKMKNKPNRPVSASKVHPGAPSADENA